MKNFQGKMPQVDFGPGCIAGIPAVLASLSDVRNVMLVMDPGVKAAGLGDPVAKVISEAGYTVIEWTDIAQDPTDVIIEECAVKAKELNCQAFVGVGGGAVLDFTKVLAMIVNHEPPLMDYCPFTNAKIIDKDCTPWIAVPTTAGTGSEVTPMSLITATKIDNRKMMVVDVTQLHKMKAKACFLDPELITGLPQSLTASTGMDALSHCVEAYFLEAATEYSDMWALRAIQMIGKEKALSNAYYNGNDLDARGKMMYAAMAAAEAFGSCGVLNIGHAIAHGIGETSHVPHGIACAWGLPYCIRRSCAVAEDWRVEKAADAMGLETAGKNKAQLVKEMEAAVMDMMKEFKIPTPKAYGIATPENLEAGCYASFNYEAWMLQAGNVEVKEDELHGYYEEMWAWEW